MTRITTTSTMNTRRIRSAGRRLLFLARWRSRLEGTATWPPRMGPGNSGLTPGRRVDGGEEARGRPVGLPEERPLGREPPGVDGSLGGTVGVETACLTGSWIERRRAPLCCAGEGQFPMIGSPSGGTLDGGPGQESVGTHDPWKPKGTRAGRWTVATGGPANEVASSMTRSLAPRVASKTTERTHPSSSPRPSAALTKTASPGERYSPGSNRVDSSRTRSYLTRPSKEGSSGLSLIH